MNTRILLLALSVVALSSCSSAYRSGQTPDDVYYSPARPQMVASNNSDDEYYDVRQQKPGTNYQSYEQYQDSYRDDRFLRMSVGNPYYLNSYNMYSGFDWRYNSLYYGYNYGFYSPWNNYFAWNNFYNPYASPYSYYGLGLGYGGYYGGGYYGGGGYYAGGGGVKYISAAPISRPVTFNVSSYTNNRPASRSYTPASYYNGGQRYNNANSTSSGGNRSYYNNSNSGNRSSTPSYTPANNNNSYTPSRSYTPSSGGGGGGGGSTGGGGGGGGISRPGRGN
ncbi:MAG: hypothetical protein QM726_21135 [Chitinophagaceae bacterium]